MAPAALMLRASVDVLLGAVNVVIVPAASRTNPVKGPSWSLIEKTPATTPASLML
jgi:hypothetical protein